MHREDNSLFLLFIEPKKEEKLTGPVNDEWTELMQRAMGEADKGTSSYSNKNCITETNFQKGNGYRGLHLTECGQHSSGVDLLLKNGMVTNSLAAFYLQWYRNSIPETEWNKLEKLKEFYEEKDKTTSA